LIDQLIIRTRKSRYSVDDVIWLHVTDAVVGCRLSTQLFQQPTTLCRKRPVSYSTFSNSHLEFRGLWTTKV